MNSDFGFYSTNNRNINLPLKDALFRGLAEDGGLYLPRKIPLLPASFFKELPSSNYPRMAFVLAKYLIGDAVPDDELKSIVNDSFNFSVPLVKVKPNRYALELFHGPTLSFKDFGARFMARLFGYFLRDGKQSLNVLVATSGDTGSAVAHGFYGIPGVKVWILYPSKKVSPVQEQQMTTLGHNVRAIEVQGTFDDCQRLVKQAFNDQELRSKIALTSANSINIARLIPQIFYYFYGYAQVKNHDLPLVFSVPSGNFGNLCAGLLAKKMGLPVSRFVAATNVNDVVPDYLTTGIFNARPSVHTISNAMDVGNPSNFARILDLYGSDVHLVRSDIWGASYTDVQTLQAISDVYADYGYVMDPHGAVAYLGLESYAKKHGPEFTGIFLETAHPAKFADSVKEAIHTEVAIPGALSECLNKRKKSVVISADYKLLKDCMLLE